VAKIRLRILGESVIEVGDRSITPSATHLFALLLYLGIERDRSVTRSELAALLFPEEQSSSAAHNLRQLLYRARQMGAPIETSASSVRVAASDVVDGVREALSGRYAPSGSDGATGFSLLPHYAPPTGPLSRWLEAFRDRMHQQLLRRLGEDMHAARRGADWRVVDLLAKASLELDPFNESATLCMAEALAHSGSKHKALNLLREFEREVGLSAEALTLPTRLLKRRICETSPSRDTMSGVPLVGRASEMKWLAELWSRARSGRCTTVAIVGEKSVGKSRLVAELLSVVRLDASGTIVLTQRFSADQHRPMSLFADICKQLICVPGAAGCAPSSVAFLKKLSETSDLLIRPEGDGLDAKYSAHGVRNALADLLESVGSERPLLLAVESAQHLDDASRAMIAGLASQSPRLPLLTLLELPETSQDIPGVQVLRVSPLDSTSSLLLSEQLVECNRLCVDASEQEWCSTLAAGNPGHLELSLAHASSTSSRHTVPTDLLSLVDERIATCTQQARHALLAVAISGSDCSVRVVERLTGFERYTLVCALEELERNALISASSRGVQCRSVLVQERVLASAPRAVVSVLNSRAAELLEHSLRGKPISQALAWRIAAHWKEAGDVQRTRRWEQTCWHHAVSIGQPMMAARDIRSAVDLSTSPEDRARLLDELANALQAASEPALLAIALRERLALAPHVGTSRKRQKALECDYIEASLVDHDDERDFLEKISALLRSPQLDARRRIRTARRLLIIAHNLLDVRLANEAYAAIRSADAPDKASVLFQAQGRLIYHTIFGSVSEALEEADRLTQLLRANEAWWQGITSALNVSLARLIVDPHPVDLTDLYEYFERCKSADMHTLALFCAARICNVLFEGGLLSEAATWSDRAESMAKHTKAGRPLMDHLSSRTDLMIASGDFREARALIEAMTHQIPRLKHGLNQHAVFLHRLRYEQVCEGVPCSDADLARQLQWHQSARSYGRHDNQMEMLWVSLRSRGREVEASETLTEYLSVSRRDRRPAQYLLRTRTAEDPAWRDASTARDSRPRRDAKLRLDGLSARSDRR
jgi:DNA-binding SARP family transcriptional activator